MYCRKCTNELDSYSVCSSCYESSASGIRDSAFKRLQAENEELLREIEKLRPYKDDVGILEKKLIESEGKTRELGALADSMGEFLRSSRRKLYQWYGLSPVINEMDDLIKAYNKRCSNE